MITSGSIAVINVWFLREEFASGSPHGRDLGVSHIRADSPFPADFVAFHLIDLDYVLGAYRDSRLGRSLYGPGAQVFRADGFDQLRSAGVTDTHRKYLERVGFQRSSDDPDLYTLTL